MSRGKKVTQQTLIGEAGIALIHERVTEMGFLFHPRRVDHGIDGHIDLVDPGTRDVLNLVLLVQSKASTMPFPYENADGFQYTCDDRDLNYWLSGNAPVILVLSHPDQRKAWWVDIKAELSDPKLRATRTVRIDKHRQVFDASAAQALLGRAVPKNSGLFLASPPKRETLTSNLLRVENLPAVLHIAPAAVTTYPAAGELLARERGADGGGWILRDGLVISFSDLTEAPLRYYASATLSGTRRRSGRKVMTWTRCTGSCTYSAGRSGLTAAQTCAGIRNAVTCTFVPRGTWLPARRAWTGPTRTYCIRPLLLEDGPGEDQLLPARRAGLSFPADRRHLVLPTRRRLLLHPGRIPGICLRRQPAGQDQAPGPARGSSGLDPHMGKLPEPPAKPVRRTSQEHHIR